MQYYTVCPFLLEYYEERLQGNMIVERAITENILPKTFNRNACTMQPLHVLPILYSGWQYNFSNPEYGVAHNFAQPLLYLSYLKVSRVMVNHIQDSIVILNQQLDPSLVLIHETVGYLQSGFAL